jgi:23S rRNA pseudouridine1911/1915/1917 synthase
MICPDNELDDYNDFCEIRVIPVPNTLGGKRLDVVLQQLLPEFSRSRLQAWIKAGKVSIEENIANTKSRIYGGEKLTVVIEPPEQTLAFHQAQSIALDVLYEDSALIVLNKPAGLVVHPGSGNWSATLLNGLLFYWPDLQALPRAGIVHRLDKDTSGLMVVAKTLQAQTHLVRQLQARTVNRHYLALVNGRVKEGGVVEQPIGRHLRDRVKMAVVTAGKPAKTHYAVRENFKQFTLLECKLETGRTHQIRVHMQYLGHPLAADPVYGGRPRQWPERVQQALSLFNRQALHAYRLALIHPETEKIIGWEIPLAQDMQTLLEVIRDTPIDYCD